MKIMASPVVEKPRKARRLSSVTDACRLECRASPHGPVQIPNTLKPIPNAHICDIYVHRVSEKSSTS